MMPGLLLSLAIAMLAYVVIVTFLDRFATKRRLAHVVGIGLERSAIAPDKKEIIARIEEQNKNKKISLLTKFIESAGVQYSENQVKLGIFSVSLVAGLAIYFIFDLTVIAVLIGLLLNYVVPRIVFSFLISRRKKAFLEELPSALDMISRGVKAGMTFITCVKQIADTTNEPLRSEFAYVLDLQNIGVPIADAIKKMPERIDLIELRFFAIVIEIQQKSGGNLAEILEKLSAVIRTRKELRAKVQSLLAEAKTSCVIISGIPVFFALFSWWNDPVIFSKFWTEPVGIVLSVIAIMSYSVGVIIFIKLATPKI